MRPAAVQMLLLAMTRSVAATLSADSGVAIDPAEAPAAHELLIYDDY